MITRPDQPGGMTCICVGVEHWKKCCFESLLLFLKNEEEEEEMRQSEGTGQQDAVRDEQMPQYR